MRPAFRIHNAHVVHDSTISPAGIALERQEEAAGSINNTVGGIISTACGNLKGK